MADGVAMALQAPSPLTLQPQCRRIRSVTLQPGHTLADSRLQQGCRHSVVVPQVNKLLTVIEPLDPIVLIPLQRVEFLSESFVGSARLGEFADAVSSLESDSVRIYSGTRDSGSYENIIHTRGES